MNPTAPQPPPQPGTAPHSVDLVVVDLAERKRHGVEKYGVAHQFDNGRDHLVDLYQELLDGCVYIRAEIERRRVDGQQVNDCYTFLEAGAAHGLIAGRMRDIPLLVHFKMAANTIAAQQADLDATRAELDKIRLQLNRALIKLAAFTTGAA